MTLTGTLRAIQRHGFRVHPGRLAEAPRVDFRPAEDVSGAGAREHSVEIRGVVCGVCAARTEAALAAVPGVESATVDLGRGRALVRLLPGARVDATALQRSLEGVVIGMGVRRRIEAVAGRVDQLAGRTSWQRTSR